MNAGDQRLETALGGAHTESAKTLARAKKRRAHVSGSGCPSPAPPNEHTHTRKEAHAPPTQLVPRAWIAMQSCKRRCGSRKAAHQASLSTASAPASPFPPSAAPSSASHTARNPQPTEERRTSRNETGQPQRRVHGLQERVAPGRAPRLTSRMTSRTKPTRLFSTCVRQAMATQAHSMAAAPAEGRTRRRKACRKRWRNSAMRTESGTVLAFALAPMESCTPKRLQASRLQASRLQASGCRPPAASLRLKVQRSVSTRQGRLL